jgi:hypothetical protein
VLQEPHSCLMQVVQVVTLILCCATKKVEDYLVASIVSWARPWTYNAVRVIVCKLDMIRKVMPGGGDQLVLRRMNFAEDIQVILPAVAVSRHSSFLPVARYVRRYDGLEIGMQSWTLQNRSESE